MIDSTLNELFSEILDMSICIDGIWYAPLQETLTTLFTCAFVVGVVCGAVSWLFWQVLELIDFLVHSLWHRFRSKQLEG